MAKAVLARATREGKIFLQLTGAASNFEAFKTTVESLGDVAHLIPLKRDIKKLQRISDDRLIDLIKSTEKEASKKFGEFYQITEFVLIGE